MMNATRSGAWPFVRPATVADLPRCAAIINDYIDATEWLPRTATRENIAAMFNPQLLAKRTLLVAELGDTVVGYLSLDATAGFVHALYLSPEARSQGIGSLLLDAARSHAPDRMELTVFEPNRAARRFYEREGFVEVPERRKDDTEEGVPTLLMRWRSAA